MNLLSSMTHELMNLRSFLEYVTNSFKISLQDFQLHFKSNNGMQ